MFTEQQIIDGIKEVKDKIKLKELEIEALRLDIRRFQTFCPHIKTYTHYDYGGGSDTICEICGKYVYSR